MSASNDWGDFLQHLITTADLDAAGEPVAAEIIDNVLVVYQLDDPPAFIRSILLHADEENVLDSRIEYWQPMRPPYEGEYLEGYEPALVPYDS